MLTFLFYAALLAAFFVAGLYVLDWFIKSDGRKGDENISLDAVFIAGVVLTGTAAFMVIGLLTGKLALVKLAFLAIPAGLIGTYLWRAKNASDNKKLSLELLSDEEAHIREAARSDPKNAAAWARLAEIAEIKGELGKTIDYLEKLRELEPSKETDVKLEFLREKKDRH